jgi:hypothetical protein
MSETGGWFHRQKNIGSFSSGIKIRGCLDRQVYRALVPDLDAPRIRKSGKRKEDPKYSIRIGPPTRA